jgi:hypothetical protein
VGVPANTQVRVIATGRSLVSGRTFNLAIAFEHEKDKQGNLLGCAIAESTFHYFCDYNCDVNNGCPCFVDEPPDNTMQTEPRARRSQSLSPKLTAMAGSHVKLAICS